MKFRCTLPVPIMLMAAGAQAIADVTLVQEGYAAQRFGDSLRLPATAPGCS